MILIVRTDSSQAEIGLWDGKKNLENYQWEAGRQLSAQLLNQITNLLKKHQCGFDQLTGIVFFKGPGSFTGLRIGATVANAIAYSKNIPIVGANGSGWQAAGLSFLAAGNNDIQVLPEYGAPANVTKPKST